MFANGDIVVRVEQAITNGDDPAVGDLRAFLQTRYVPASMQRKPSHFRLRFRLGGVGNVDNIVFHDFDQQDVSASITICNREVQSLKYSDRAGWNA